MPSDPDLSISTERRRSSDPLSRVERAIDDLDFWDAMDSGRDSGDGRAPVRLKVLGKHPVQSNGERAATAYLAPASIPPQAQGLLPSQRVRLPEPSRADAAVVGSAPEGLDHGRPRSGRNGTEGARRSKASAGVLAAGASRAGRGLVAFLAAVAAVAVWATGGANLPTDARCLLPLELPRLVLPAGALPSSAPPEAEPSSEAAPSAFSASETNAEPLRAAAVAPASKPKRRRTDSAAGPPAEAPNPHALAPPAPPASASALPSASAPNDRWFRK